MSHESHDGCCAALLVKPSGEVVLVCKHTREPLSHALPLRVLNVKFNHKSAASSFAEVKVECKLPVLCDAGETFELCGGKILATLCDCVAHDEVVAE